MLLRHGVPVLATSEPNLAFCTSFTLTSFLENTIASEIMDELVRETSRYPHRSLFMDARQLSRYHCRGTSCGGKGRKEAL